MSNSRCVVGSRPGRSRAKRADPNSTVYRKTDCAGRATSQDRLSDTRSVHFRARGRFCDTLSSSHVAVAMLEATRTRVGGRFVQTGTHRHRFFTDYWLFPHNCKLHYITMQARRLEGR